MTQEAFKAWWYNEGSQAPYTHHDCEEHTMRMCEIAWANGAYKALAEHAMSEVQRLGQEIEQELKIKTTDPFESSRVADYNRGWNDCLFASGIVKQPEQEPVAWMDADGNVSDNNDHKCFPIPLYTKEQP